MDPARIGVALLAAFFDCGGGGADGGPEQSPVNQGAWQNGRVLYARTDAGVLSTIRDDGTDRQTLVELDEPTCPGVSADGSRIVTTLRTTDELILLRPGGDNSLYPGLSGRALDNAVLGTDGTTVAFSEATGAAAGACTPSRVVTGGSAGVGLEARTPEGECARWPEFSDDGTLVAYERETTDGVRDVCTLDGATGIPLGCIGIADLHGMRAWSPDGRLLLGTDFRSWRSEDGMETSDPIAEIEDLMPPPGPNDLRMRVEDALAGLGVAPIDTDRFPISLDWGPERVLVFDALTDGPGGPGVHVFTFDLETDEIRHLDGPLGFEGSNANEFSLACPRFLP
jgi:hypothetical protein